MEIWNGIAQFMVCQIQHEVEIHESLSMLMVSSLLSIFIHLLLLQYHQCMKERTGPGPMHTFSELKNHCKITNHTCTYAPATVISKEKRGMFLGNQENARPFQKLSKKLSRRNAFQL